MTDTARDVTAEETTPEQMRELARLAHRIGGDAESIEAVRDMLNDAAAQVERLTAERDEFRGILQPYTCHVCETMTGNHSDFCSFRGTAIDRILDEHATTLAAERDALAAENARIQAARQVEVTTVFKRATEAEAARDQQAVMLKDMNTLATGLTAERDALQARVAELTMMRDGFIEQLADHSELLDECDALREQLKQAREYLEHSAQPGVYYLNVRIDALLAREPDHA